ncbi:hypothetical protein IscW_ISCW021975 [Ixodes scapularis]|uniref:Uncharacterized protein n=1 Tax=Ixodes scapularis TaxID=6945 RepID=B7QFY2_IXOSC|nr:hypothetical protein IscW_ISCW021975 [Ixodes scapularis]|eukprot:XP_002401045.1 hypothetical protein IscW_ISCW021975 [Ixodes scapularis]
MSVLFSSLDSRAVFDVQLDCPSYACALSGGDLRYLSTQSVCLASFVLSHQMRGRLWPFPASKPLPKHRSNGVQRGRLTFFPDISADLLRRRSSHRVTLRRTTNQPPESPSAAIPRLVRYRLALFHRFVERFSG